MSAEAEAETKMKVTRIEELTKSRSRVYLEEQFAFVLYKGELRSFHVAEGEELAPQDYETIMKQILPRRARLRAMNLLKGREYTVRQLHDKLRDGGYPEEIIADALAYVESFHYTDDLRYATAYITGHENSRSRRRIEQDLAARGIDPETAKKAWQEWEAQGGRQDEQAMIRKLLEKRGFDPETADEKEIRRQGAFLMRRGFAGEAVRKALFE